MFVSKEVAQQLRRNQRRIEQRIGRLQALALEWNAPELDRELGHLAGCLHRQGGLLFAVLEAVTEDGEPDAGSESDSGPPQR